VRFRELGITGIISVVVTALGAGGLRKGTEVKHIIVWCCKVLSDELMATLLREYECKSKRTRTEMLWRMKPSMMLRMHQKEEELASRTRIAPNVSCSPWVHSRQNIRSLEDRRPIKRVNQQEAETTVRLQLLGACLEGNSTGCTGQPRLCSHHRAVLTLQWQATGSRDAIHIARHHRIRSSLSSSGREPWPTSHDFKDDSFHGPETIHIGRRRPYLLR
jgi:hypothetical protein